jgi:hypothetical protein
MVSLKDLIFLFAYFDLLELFRLMNTPLEFFYDSLPADINVVVPKTVPLLYLTLSIVVLVLQLL